ncbi:MAG: nucleotidyltransferase family protein [Tepidiphilus sp.]|nr:nucleotidyltransferase family protein [Tepidiphilus sp.]MDD3433463.1 nucleotidyltransferase family protein [Tepidiphilus sp.]
MATLSEAAPFVAMILAAGRGERLRPLTDTCPKPLVEVGGKALIDHWLDRLAEAGCRRVVVNPCWLGERIVPHLEQRQRSAMELLFSPEPAPGLETAGGVRQALPLLDAASFLVVNADVYCPLDLAAFVRRAYRQLEAGFLAHLLLVPNPAHHPGGDFALGGDAMVYPEAVDARGEPLTFSGIGFYRAELFQPLPAGARAPLAPLLRAAMRAGKVSGERHDGLWVDVGTPERLESLRRQLSAAGKERTP